MLLAITQKYINPLYTILYSILVFIAISSIGYTYFYEPELSVKTKKGYTTSLDHDKLKEFSPEKIKNILIVEQAAKYVHHPDPKRMVAHLLNESSAKTIIEGDIKNGPFKKSYGIMQVKLGTLYYIKGKRPDLIKLYAPEVNAISKEEALEKLRKNPYFNAKIAALYHIMLTELCKDEEKASIAYNTGSCKKSAKGLDYLKKLHDNLDLI